MLPTFDHSQRKFSVESAYVLLRASQAAYAHDLAGYRDRLEELGIAQSNQKWIQSQFDACFLGWTDKWVILSFRGTENPGGWVSNLYGAVPVARPRDYYGKVHPGFADGLDSLWDPILAELSSPSLSDKPLFVTGHSRGGALATLAAQSLFYNGIKPVAVYTYGSPRVGNAAFTKRYDISNHYRIENDRDIVPNVPPRPVFDHVGDRYWLDSEGQMEVVESESSTAAIVKATLEDHASDSLGRVGTSILGGVVAKSLLAPEFFSDHSNTEYAYWLWKLLSGAARDDAGTSSYP